VALPKVVDELDRGFGWISREQPRLRMASHALLAGGRVWVVDPTEPPAVEDRFRRVGDPCG
jgi:hypothetical protein